jgi:hypothetical protein
MKFVAIMTLVYTLCWFGGWIALKVARYFEKNPMSPERYGQMLRAARVIWISWASLCCLYLLTACSPCHNPFYRNTICIIPR